uniref:G_PROTEIN_RECEP_F1_2 domain-containing protein n=1 Tax=Macrostomum lignano TaxID=282301 RepID=A0A1I8F419_9PLAT
SVSNYLILSLAVADLMVATLVMPICALKEMSKVWWLGVHLCDLWTCLDVLCCTASILHLVGIAVDRYWAVTNINYIRTRTGRRIGLMIAAIWIISAAISAPARFWRMRKEPDECRINESPAYTVFSTVGAFYLPMLFMIGIYLRIYHARSQKNSSESLQAKPAGGFGRGNCRCDGAAAAAAGGEKIHIRFRPHAGKKTAAETATTKRSSRSSGAHHHPVQSGYAAREAGTETRKEGSKNPGDNYRLLSVLLVPFFVRAIVCPFYSPLCTDLISETGHSLIQWLGYTNSLLNPVIYTIFSPDFRSAFSKILFGRYRR